MRDQFSWPGVAERKKVLASDFPATTRLVLLALSFAKEDGEAPNVARLSHLTGLKNRTITAHLRLAKSRGFLPEVFTTRHGA